MSYKTHSAPFYKTYSNKLKPVIAMAKNNFYRQQFEKFKHNSRKVWQTTNEIIGKNKTH